MAHADDATKTLSKAVPTKDSEGNVTKWDISMTYNKNDYEVEYTHEVYQTEDGEENFTSQAPSSFTKSDLTALCPTSHWDNIYNSQYESTHPEVEPAVETADNDFDVNSLDD